MSRFDSAAHEANDYKERYMKHSQLWKESRQDALEKFLLSGEEKNEQPSLEKFQEEVNIAYCQN